MEKKSKFKWEFLDTARLVEIIFLTVALVGIVIFLFNGTHPKPTPVPTLEPTPTPTPVPTPEIDRIDFRLDFPEGVPSQGINIVIEGDLLSLMNTSLTVFNTEIDAEQPGNYHIDPSMMTDDHFNITIWSLNRISKSFSHAALGDTDYYTFTVLPD